MTQESKTLFDETTKGCLTQEINNDALIKAYNYVLKMKESQKKYSITHRDEINESHNKYYHKSIKNDPEKKEKRRIIRRNCYLKKKANMTEEEKELKKQKDRENYSLKIKCKL
jgi:hypothetical protein